MGTEKTVSELAIVRINKEIHEIEEAIEKIRQNIIYALNDPQAMREIRNILASRRDSFFEKRSFIKSATINDCVQEIYSLPVDEFEQLR